jgi:PhnB protein
MPGHPDFDRLMQGVIPYLAIEECAKAIAFYEKAFGAITHGVVHKDEQGHVMNATLEINGGILMLMDARPDLGIPEMSKATNIGTTMQLVTPDGDLWWNRAVEAGCTVTHAFKTEFWGDRYGRLRDPFGLDWAINEPAKPQP